MIHVFSPFLVFDLQVILHSFAFLVVNLYCLFYVSVVCFRFFSSRGSLGLVIYRGLGFLLVFWFLFCANTLIVFSLFGLLCPVPQILVGDGDSILCTKQFGVT